MRYILIYKLIYVILLASNLALILIYMRIDGVSDLNVLFLAITSLWLALNFFDLIQIKNKNLNKGLCKRELAISISRLGAIVILPTGVGPFLLMFSPIFFVFWSPIFTRVGESYVSGSTGGFAIFGYYFLILTLFLLELLNMRLTNKSMVN